MSKKSLIALGLSLAMTFSLVACGDSPTSNGNESTEVSTSTESSVASSESEVKEFDPRSITEGVTLTIAVESDAEIIDYNTNKSTLILEEKFGVDLVFEEYAAADFTEKLNVMINGGDKLPDIIFGQGTNQGLSSMEKAWAETGAILELSEFYANPDYAKYINIAIEREGDFVSTLRDLDGKIWGLPKYYPAVNDATAYRLWINTEYAKACGFEEMPKTTEEFFELCKAFDAAGDLNGNGLDDEVVFTSYGKINREWFRFLMSAFEDAWDNEYLELTNGKLEFAYTTDDWKEGLKYIKRFFDEGLIDTTIITQDKAAYQSIAYDPSMPVLCEFYYMPRMVGADELETQLCQLAYSYVCALEGPSGVAEAYYKDPAAYNGAMITTDCENPEAAFIVLDYLMSEEMSIRNRWGEEGENWDFWENVDESRLPDGMTVEEMKARNNPDATWLNYGNDTYWAQGNPQNAGYMLGGPSIHFTNFMASIAGDPNSADETVAAKSKWNMLLDQMWADMVEMRPKERIISLPMSVEESDAIAEPASVIDAYWKEAAANFVTGVWDIDEYWSTYLTELEKMGIDEVLATYQTAYDRTK